MWVRRFFRFCHFFGGGFFGLVAATLLSLPVLLSLPAGAQVNRNTLYTVRDVAVDVTAESVSQAKEQALAQGKARAFDFLMDRLTASDQRNRIPALTPEQVLPLIRDFSLRDEKQSPVRYRAKLTVRFAQVRILSLLRQSGVSVTETVSQPALLLPVWSQGGRLLLWEDENRWRDAWLAIDLGGALVPLVIPPGDLEDLTRLNAEGAVGGAEGIWSLAEKYGARDVLVSRLLTDQKGAVVQLGLRRFERSSPEAAREQIIAPDFNRDKAGDLESLARALNNRIQEDWIMANRVTGTSQQQISVLVPITGLADWVAMKGKIDRTSAIKRSSLTALKRGEARLTLFFPGTIAQLSRALAQESAVLRPQESGFWTLRHEEKRRPAPDSLPLQPDPVQPDLAEPDNAPPVRETPLSPTVVIE